MCNQFNKVFIQTGRIRITALLALASLAGIGVADNDPESVGYQYGNWRISENKTDPFNPGGYRVSASVWAKSDPDRDWEFILIAQCENTGHARIGDNSPLYSSHNRHPAEKRDVWQVKKLFTDARPDEMKIIQNSRHWLTPDGVHKNAPEAVSNAVKSLSGVWPGAWAYLLDAITGADIEIWTYFYAEYTNLTDERMGKFPLDVAFGGPEHEGDVRTLQAFNQHGDKFWHIDHHDQTWLTFRINSSDRMFARWNQFRTGNLIAEFDLDNGKAALSEIKRRCALHREM